MNYKISLSRKENVWILAGYDVKTDRQQGIVWQGDSYEDVQYFAERFQDLIADVAARPVEVTPDNTVAANLSVVKEVSEENTPTKIKKAA